MANQVKSRVEAQLKQVRAGVQSELSPAATLYLGGEQYTSTQVLAKLDRWLSLFAATAAARTQWTAALTALRPELRIEHRFVRNLLQAVTLQFGEGSPPLAAFGIAPPKARVPLAPGQKALAVAKARATRKLRGTLSRKQRLKLGAAPAPAQLLIRTNGEAVEIAAAADRPTSAVDPAPVQR